VGEAGRFYRDQTGPSSTHLALRWKGRVRYTVPLETAGQKACWQVFGPGVLGIPLRAMARMPRLPGSIGCTEGAPIRLIRDAIGEETGLSCCRTGAAGPWSKDTILFLDKQNAKPVYFVKAGVGAAVNSLLQNEADWLRKLRGDSTLALHVPEMVAHRSGDDLCFVAQRPLAGDLDFRLGPLQLDFLRKLQEPSLHARHFEESSLYRNLSSRLADLEGYLPAEWSTRLNRAMHRIEKGLSGAPANLVDAHNDFTPWNIRIRSNLAYVFDWEYAANQHLPLFDPLHFALLPMALRRQPTEKMMRRIHETQQLCQECLGREACNEMQTQTLAYLINLCTLYLWSERGTSGSSPVIESYARMIDCAFSD